VARPRRRSSETRRGRVPSGAARPFRVVSGLGFGRGIVATRAIPPGAPIASWAGARIRRSPTYQSVQVGERRHADDPACLNLLNHSCAPNVRIHVGRRAVVALRRIAPGELLTFFYPSTEWRMARPFRCRCGAPGGLVFVSGARDVPMAVLRRFPASAHILRLKRAQARSR
jgi:SET domain-containing protein